MKAGQVRLDSRTTKNRGPLATSCYPAFPSTAMDLLDHKGGASSMMRDAVL